MIEPEIDVPAKRVNGRMWQPGESGNPNGRPVGARGRFSQRFIADLMTPGRNTGRQHLNRRPSFTLIDLSGSALT